MIQSNGYRVEIHNITFFTEDGGSITEDELNLNVLRSRRGTFFVNPGESYSFKVPYSNSPVMAYEVVAESWGGYADLTLQASANSTYQPTPPPPPIEPTPPSHENCEDQYLSDQNQLNQCNQEVMGLIQQNSKLESLVNLLRDQVNKKDSHLNHCIQEKSDLSQAIAQAETQTKRAREDKRNLRKRLVRLDKKLEESKTSAKKYECTLYDRHNSMMVGQGATIGMAMFNALNGKCIKETCGKYKWPEKKREKTVCRAIR